MYNRDADVDGFVVLIIVAAVTRPYKRKILVAWCEGWQPLGLFCIQDLNWVNSVNVCALVTAVCNRAMQ